MPDKGQSGQDPVTELTVSGWIPRGVCTGGGSSRMVAAGYSSESGSVDGRDGSGLRSGSRSTGELLAGV